MAFLGYFAPVVVNDVLLTLSPFSVQVRSELELRVKEDVVAKLGVLKDLVEIDLFEGLEVDGGKEGRLPLTMSVPVCVRVTVTMAMTMWDGCLGAVWVARRC